MLIVVGTMRILVIDDDPVSRQIVKGGLKKAGYRLTAVGTAKDGLKELESEDPVAIVITDVMLPDMTGLDFLGLLRSTPQYSELPVIVCTASETRSFRELAETFEAAAFFPKPIQMRDLKKAVKEILGRSVPCISDLRPISQRMDMTTDECIEMIDAVQQQLQELLAKADDLLAAGDIRALRDGLGALRGAAESVGAKRVAGVLRKVDETRNDLHPDVLRAILPELKRESTLLGEANEALKILPKTPSTMVEIRIASLCGDSGEEGGVDISATEEASTVASADVVTPSPEATAESANAKSSAGESEPPEAEATSASSAKK